MILGPEVKTFSYNVGEHVWGYAFCVGAAAREHNAVRLEDGGGVRAVRQRGVAFDEIALSARLPRLNDPSKALLQAGDILHMRLSGDDLLKQVGQDGVYRLALQVWGDSGYHAGAGHVITLKSSKPQLSVSQARKKGGGVVALAKSSDPFLDTVTCSVDGENVEGTRQGRGFYFFTLANDALFTLRATDTGGNFHEVTRRAQSPLAPPSAPIPTGEFELPPWLKDRKDNRHYMAAIRAALPDLESVPKQMNIDTASAPYLDIYADLMGVTRVAGESDSTLRKRAKAAPYVGGSFALLGEHLSNVMGVNITVQTARANGGGGPLQLTGEWRLSGNVKLGANTDGVALDHRASVYIGGDPQVPLGVLFAELRRLSPAGIFYRVVRARTRARIGITHQIGGERTVTLRHGGVVNTLINATKLDGSWQLDGSRTLGGNVVKRTRLEVTS